jgi:hypothetical protein
MEGANPVQANHSSMPSGIDQSVPEQEEDRMNRCVSASAYDIVERVLTLSLL